MFMKRMFLPAGQGAFYCERFMNRAGNWKMNFVYDCGVLLFCPGISNDSQLCKNRLQWLEDVIDSIFDEGEAIETVFISHLHEDHISGLKHLAKRCKIKRIYLPFVDKESRQLMLLDYVTRSLKSTNYTSDGRNDFVAKVLTSEDLESSLPGLLDLEVKPDVQVVRGDDGEQVVPVGTSRNSDEDTLGISASYSGRDKAVSLSYFWKYKLFCITDDNAANNVKKQLLELANNELGENKTEITAESVAKLINKSCDPDNKHRKSMINKICNIYKDNVESSDYNKQSLVVYSACCDTERLWTVKEHCPHLFSGAHSSCLNLPKGKQSYHHSCKKYAVSCLYTGDFNAQDEECWKKLKGKFSSKEWESIGCVQIPHHGSRGSYNGKFLDMEACHVISAGLGSCFRHPSLSVLDTYQGRGGFPIVVTQNPNSCVCFSISPR